MLYSLTYRSRSFLLASIAVSFLVGSHLLGHVPGVHQPHDLVAEVGGGPEHQRASAVDDRDAVLPAVASGGVGDAAGAGAAVHPHLGDAEVGALAHGVFGGRGP